MAGFDWIRKVLDKRIDVVFVCRGQPSRIEMADQSCGVDPISIVAVADVSGSNC